MSWIGKIFGTAAGETIKGTLEGVGSFAQDIRSAITGDMKPETRARLEEMAIQADQLAQQSQAAINAVEAQHPSLFIAGWRPFIGWCCGVAIGWNYVIHPMVTWAMAIWWTDIEPPPAMSLTELWPVVVGMLGLGVYRSYEKKIGVQHRH